MRKLLAGSGLVVDTFDNSVGRRDVQAACADLGVPCLHVGLASDYAEAIWDPGYRVPSPVRDDVCDYPLARNLVRLTVAVAAESIVGFAANGDTRSYTVTFGDFAVRPFTTA